MIGLRYRQVDRRRRVSPKKEKEFARKTCPPIKIRHPAHQALFWWPKNDLDTAVDVFARKEFYRNSELAPKLLYELQHFYFKSVWPFLSKWLCVDYSIQYHSMYCAGGERDMMMRDEWMLRNECVNECEFCVWSSPQRAGETAKRFSSFSFAKKLRCWKWWRWISNWISYVMSWGTV